MAGAIGGERYDHLSRTPNNTIKGSYCMSSMCVGACVSSNDLSLFITYDEERNKGHIYRTISHVCHNKIVCPLGNFEACDWLS